MFYVRFVDGTSLMIKEIDTSDVLNQFNNFDNI